MTEPTKDTPINPDPTTTSGNRFDETTGGEDSSPLEGVPSGEKEAAAREPQNAPKK